MTTQSFKGRQIMQFEGILTSVLGDSVSYIHSFVLDR